MTELEYEFTNLGWRCSDGQHYAYGGKKSSARAHLKKAKERMGQEQTITIDWSKIQADHDLAEKKEQELKQIKTFEQQAAYHVARVNDPTLTPEKQAIRQWLSKPAPYQGACGCMGPAALPGQPKCDGTNWDQIKREPLCVCAMSYVEEVDNHFYKINEHRSPDGITHTATLLGPVGGPYTVDPYGRPV